MSVDWEMKFSDFKFHMCSQAHSFLSSAVSLCLFCLRSKCSLHEGWIRSEGTGEYDSGLGASHWVWLVSAWGISPCLGFGFGFCPAATFSLWAQVSSWTWHPSFMASGPDILAVPTSSQSRLFQALSTGSWKGLKILLLLVSGQQNQTFREL